MEGAGREGERVGEAAADEGTRFEKNQSVDQSAGRCTRAHARTFAQIPLVFFLLFVTANY